MCWFTLTPAKGKKHPGPQSSDSSCAEELVRVHRSPSRHRFTEVKVKMPSSVSMEMSEHHHHLHPHLHPHPHPHLHPHLHHHHRHPHLHPLHLHPIHGHHHHHHLDHVVEKLHGHGRRRCSPPPVPPPTRSPSHCRRPRSPSPSPRSPPREPIYRTQIVEPSNHIRETTRIALRSTQTERQRGRLRRVAGYEVLGNQVPFDWDCVSSSMGSGVQAGGGRWVRKKGKKKGGGNGSGVGYPPFGGPERWM